MINMYFTSQQTERESDAQESSKRTSEALLSCALVAFLLIGIPSHTLLAEGVPSISKPPTIETYGILEGLVQIYDHHVYIITNYKSRSRIDYRVTGKLKNRVAQREGQLILVEGKITRTGWTGTINVEKILHREKSGSSSPEIDQVE